MSRNRPERSHGHLEVITGGMFSGKSEELLRRLRRAVIARQRVQVFKPQTDTRSGPDRVVTRDNRALAAVTVADSEELEATIDRSADVVAIDEAQFLDLGLIEVVRRLADGGVRVIVAGLDLDFRRNPFGPIPALLAQAEYVDKMHAICVHCGEPAQYSLRIAGGTEQVQVGDTDLYEARCRSCYQEGATECQEGEQGEERAAAGADGAAPGGGR